jgi:hypothetical protein
MAEWADVDGGAEPMNGWGVWAGTAARRALGTEVVEREPADEGRRPGGEQPNLADTGRWWVS